MKKENEKSNIIKASNYLNKKYRKKSLRKLMIKTYYDKLFPYRKSGEDLNIINIPESNTYYKDPIFYNEKNLTFQINILRKISKDNWDKKINNRKYTYAKKFSNSLEKELLPNLKRNNTENLNINFTIDNKSKNNNNNYLTYKRNTFFCNRANTEDNLNNEISKSNQELPIDKLYKIIFKSQLSNNKDHLKPLIENRYNLKYSDNEEQYNLIVDKENEEKIAKGKKIKNRKPCAFIKFKLNDALDKVKFMKDVIDYSYPKYVLSKIKIKQKNLSKEKQLRIQKFDHYISEKERRYNEVIIRNNNKTKYLLKSFTFIK